MGNLPGQFWPEWRQNDKFRLKRPRILPESALEAHQQSRNVARFRFVWRGTAIQQQITHLLAILIA